MRLREFEEIEISSKAAEVTVNIAITLKTFVRISSKNSASKEEAEKMVVQM